MHRITDRISPALSALGALLLSIGANAASVSIQGLNDDERRAVLEKLAPPACLGEVWQIRQLRHRLERRIRIERRSRGDYRPRIGIVEVVSGACHQLNASVVPGAPVTIRRVELAVHGDEQARALLEPIFKRDTLRPGAVFIERNWERMKSDLGAQALENGYFDGTFESAEVRVDPAAGIADLHLVYASGPRYRVGALHIDITGRRLRDDLIDRFITIEPGEAWHSKALAVSRHNLMASGYFARVAVIPELDEATDGQVPVRIAATTVRRFEVGAGAGYATDFGPRLRIEFVDRIANRAGHHYEIRGTAAPRRSELSANYRLPARGPRSWWSFDIAAGRLETRSSRSEDLTLGVRLVTQTSDRWRRTLLLDFNASSFDVGPDNATAILASPGVAFDYDNTDDHARLPAGLTLRGQFRVGARPLGSTTTFARATAHTMWAHRLDERMRLLLRLDLGATLSVDFRQLPPGYRFFAGGDESVRGFDLGELGATDGGQVVGGKFLTAGGIELEHLLRGRWGLAWFTDAGQAFSTLPYRLEVSSGVGLRWFSPLGSIRIDVGVPWRGGPPRLHLGLGRKL